MQALRNAHFLTRLVLVWFALFVGVAVASPLVHTPSSQMVCSGGGGMKMVTSDVDGQALPSSAGMDCPMCMPLSAPPAADILPVALSGLSFASHPLAQARLAALLGLPWQARAPPLF